MYKATILKYVLNCFLFFVPPLSMMVFGNRLPPPLLVGNFSKGIPPVIEYGETIFRYAVMILAVFMPLQISTWRQQAGLAIYIVGIILYVLSWVPLILFPQSAWSTSWIGYSAALRSMDAGAAAVMVAPAAGLRTDDQIFAYYRQVAAALGPDIPFIYQDYPQSTAVYLSASLVARLAEALPSLVMLKLEDCPGLDKITRIRAEAAAAGRRRVSILAGNGGLYFPQFLRRGADGAMTGFAYPEMLVEVVSHYRAGRVSDAADAFYRFAPLLRFEFQEVVGMAIRKEILRRRGAIAHATVRMPGGALDAATLDALGRILRWSKAHGAPWISD